MELEAYNLLLATVTAVGTVLAAWIAAINVVQVNKQIKLSNKQSQLDMRISVWQRTIELFSHIQNKQYVPHELDGIYFDAPVLCNYLISGQYEVTAMIAINGEHQIDVPKHADAFIRDIKTLSLKASLIFSGDVKVSLVSFIDAYADLIASLKAYCFMLRAMQAANEQIRKPLDQYQASFHEPEKRGEVVDALRRALEAAQVLDDDRCQRRIVEQIRLDSQ